MEDSTPAHRAREGPLVPRYDALIVTALQDELEAVLALGDDGRAGWQDARDRRGLRYFYRSIAAESGHVLRLAATWTGQIGETATAVRAQQLIDELEPECVAMCGICAGRRGSVFLGDVIVAERLYSYDHGKLIAREDGGEPVMLRDIETYNLDTTWAMDAAFLARERGWAAGFVGERPLSKEAQRWWLLRALSEHEQGAGPPPNTHPDRKVACPGWEARVTELRGDGLIKLEGGRLALTEKGRAEVAEERLVRPEGRPADPDFKVHVGVIATGKTVRVDPGLFERLIHVERRTLGVEMEGAAIGYVAERFRARAIVVKAVSDYADGDKDDSYRAFACRASATFLVTFLLRHIASQLAPRRPRVEPVVSKAKPLETNRVDGSVDGRLAAAQRRQKRMAEQRLPTADVAREILSLRRERRAGGQLGPGDALGDGRYILVRHLGTGGFATVWEAKDTVRVEAVAIKVLRPEVARDESRRERFFRGARTMAEIGHEAVVRVRERHGEDDGWHYMVMDLLPGGDLRQAVREKRVSGEEALSIVLRVGEAVVAAHAKGYIHRDIKPANILLDGDGTPRLTDFDLVAAADTTGGTGTGAMGTFIYAAPELMDRPQDADARADVYGLGMTAVFGLLGAELPISMMRHAEKVIRGLACGDAVKKVLERAIDWDKEKRQPEARAFCEALRAAVEEDALAAASAAVVDTAVPSAAPVLEERTAAPAPVESEARVRDMPLPSSFGPSPVKISEERELVDLAEDPSGVLDSGARREQRRRLAGALLRVGAVVFAVAGGVGAYLYRPSASDLIPTSPAVTASAPPPVVSTTARAVSSQLPSTPEPVPTGVSGACPEGMVQIPGGTFQMGSNDGAPNEKPIHPVTVKMFCLDRTEVTVKAYTVCVNEKKCSAEHLNQYSTNAEGTTFTDGSFCNYRVDGRSNHPINCVDWTQSNAYCKARGERFHLPTEEEWEYAARGGDAQRTYPWGNDKPSSQLCWNGEGSDLGEGNRYSTCEVGKYKKGNSQWGQWGISDMAGNVWEWTESLYCPYSPNGVSNNCTDARRVLRGGGWDNVTASYVRAAYRDFWVPADRNSFIGFRCARTP